MACAVAVNTLSSSIGPIMSTLLIGAGAFIGSLRAGSNTNLHDRAT